MIIHNHHRNHRIGRARGRFHSHFGFCISTHHSLIRCSKYKSSFFIVSAKSKFSQKITKDTKGDDSPARTSPRSSTNHQSLLTFHLFDALNAGLSPHPHAPPRQRRVRAKIHSSQSV